MLSDGGTWLLTIMSAAMSSPTGTVPLNAGVNSTLSPTLFPAMHGDTRSCLKRRRCYPMLLSCKTLDKAGQ